MKKSKEPVKSVQVVLTESIHRRICEFADERAWSVSHCIREAIELYLYEKTRKRRG
jgi:hypothetical protein